MRKIRDVPRLAVWGVARRKIAASLGMRAAADGERLKRARRTGLSRPISEGLTEEALECRLYQCPADRAMDRRPQPDRLAVHCELRRPGVTAQQLWEEHRAIFPNGHGQAQPEQSRVAARIGVGGRRRPVQAVAP
jgi:hypothetical protein